jgi:hypothetical protein
MADHFLLTRFNTRAPEWRSEVGDRGTDPAWLGPRIDLFERICLPSVRAQTEQAFTWLIFMHPDTPADLAARLRDLVADVATIVEAEHGDAEAAVSAIGTPSSEEVITSRVDNDDALARDFIEAVRSHAAELGYLNFTHGAQLHIATGEACRIGHALSPFPSRVERAETIRTVWETKHNDERLRFARQIPGGVWWLQGIHDANVANPAKNGRPLRSTQVLERFDVDPDLVRSVRLRELSTRWVRFARTRIRAR